MGAARRISKSPLGDEALEELGIPKQPISYAKIAVVGLACAASVAFAFLAQPYYHDNADAVLIVATAFTILAGFLVTVIAMTADERAIRGATWRQDVIYLQLIKRDIARHRNLFYLYLSVVALAFIASLCRKSENEFQCWSERLALFFACYAMIWSFRLPGYITRRQIGALDAAIENRMRSETKPPEPLSAD